MVKVIYFASLRERLGVAEESVELGNSTTVGQLLQTLAEAHGELWHEVLLQSQVLSAVNQEMCDPDQTIADGDEVAFFRQ